MKSRPSHRKKPAPESVALPPASMKPAEDSPADAHQKLTDIGKKLGDLKSELARLAEDRKRENEK